jgi:hypothetical protein
MLQDCTAVLRDCKLISDSAKENVPTNSPYAKEKIASGLN